MPRTSTAPKTASVSIRMLPELKAEAERVFDHHGLTLADAITVFVKYACRAGGFPFELSRAPYTDPESLEALKEANELLNDPDARTFHTFEELFADLKGSDDE